MFLNGDKWKTGISFVRSDGKRGDSVQNDQFPKLRAFDNKLKSWVKSLFRPYDGINTMGSLKKLIHICSFAYLFFCVMKFSRFFDA